MAWSRNRTIVGVAAAAAAGVGYYAVQLVRSRGGLSNLWSGRRPLHRAGSAALSGEGAEGAVGHSGAARDAGADAMRDPPERWSSTDETIDETFPASDPAPAKHVD